MKMLFFSSERAEIELVHKDLIEAGISCEVRNATVTEGICPQATDAEVWIQNDRDSHRAWMLCVELGVGFARRQGKTMEAAADDGFNGLPDDESR
jgi:hypothetical protein